MNDVDIAVEYILHPEKAPVDMSQEAVTECIQRALRHPDGKRRVYGASIRVAENAKVNLLSQTTLGGGPLPEVEAAVARIDVAIVAMRQAMET
jgi:hypothetical protein